MDLIASRNKLQDGQVIEEWWTRAESLPIWWDNDLHVLKEKRHITGVALVKYCIKCNKEISDQGCKHNISK